MSDNEMIKFISLVQKKEILYDSSKGCTQQDRYLAWEEIASQMDWTAAECKKKWRSLRTACAGHHKAKNKPAGTTRKNWHLAKPMAFLSEYLNHTSTDPKPAATETDVSDAQDVRISNESCSEPSSTCMQVSREEIGKTNKRFKPSSDDEINTSTDQSNKQEDEVSRLKTPAEQLVEPMISYFKSQTPEFTESEQAFIAFARGLLPDYKQLPERKKRIFKEKMMSTLYALVDEDDEQS